MPIYGSLGREGTFYVRELPRIPFLVGWVEIILSGGVCDTACYSSGYQVASLQIYINKHCYGSQFSSRPLQLLVGNRDRSYQRAEEWDVIVR